MFSRASSLTKLSRGCRYILRPSPAFISQAPFSLTARSFSAVGAAMADTSGVTAELLQKKLEDELEAKTVKIEDLSGIILLSLSRVCLKSVIGLYVLTICSSLA